MAYASSAAADPVSGPPSAWVVASKASSNPLRVTPSPACPMLSTLTLPIPASDSRASDRGKSRTADATMQARPSYGRRRRRALEAIPDRHGLHCNRTGELAL